MGGFVGAGISLIEGALSGFPTVDGSVPFWETPNISKAVASAEVYNPMTRRGCSVGNITRKRVGHTMCNNMVCGSVYGDSSVSSTCEKFDGISTFNLLPVKLIGDRNYHLCWELKSGEVLLLGSSSSYSGQTTERVSADGLSSSLDFPLPYPLW